MSYSALDPEASRPAVTVQAPTEEWRDLRHPKDVLEEVVGVACKTWGVTTEEMLSHQRPNRIAVARMAMYALVLEATNCSFSELGRLLGRDHSTIQKGNIVARNLLDTDPRFAAAYRIARIRLGLQP